MQMKHLMLHDENSCSNTGIFTSVEPTGESVKHRDFYFHGTKWGKCQKGFEYIVLQNIFGAAISSGAIDGYVTKWCWLNTVIPSNMKWQTEVRVKLF